MIKNKIVALAMAALAALPALAQKEDLTSSYNMRMGIDAMNEEKYRDAVDAFNKELQQNPKNPYANYYIGKCYQFVDMYGPALDNYALAIENYSPKDKDGIADCLSAQAYNFWEVGLYDVARKKVAEAIAARPNAYLYAQQAFYLYSGDDYPAAVASARTSLKLAKDAPSEVDAIKYACRTLLHVFYETHDKSLAADVLKHIDAVLSGKWNEGSDGERIDLEGFRVLVVKEVKGGEAAADEAFRFYTNAQYSGDVLSNVAKLCDHKEIAEHILKKFAEQGAKTGDNDYYVRGISLMAIHRYREALEMFTKVKVSDPSWGSYDDSKIHCLQNGGKVSEAIEAMRESISSTYYDTLNIYFRIAKNEMCEGLYDEAKADLDVYLTARPANPWGRQLSGLINLYAGNLDEAQRELELAILLDPTLADTYLDIAAVFLAKGQNDLANENYRKVLELKDAHPQYRALAAAHLGDKSALAESVKKMNAQAENHYTMACIASIQRDKAEALRQIRLLIDEGNWENGPKAMMQDTDFGWLHEDVDFRAIISEYTRRIENAWK